MFWMWKPLPLPWEKYRADSHSRWGRQSHAPCWVLEAPRSRVPEAAANPCLLARKQLSGQLCPTPTGAQKKPEPSLEQLIGDIWVSAGVQSPEGCLVCWGFCVIFYINTPPHTHDSILFTIKILKLKILAWLMTHYEHCWQKNTESYSTTCLLERYHKTGQDGEKSHKM